MIITRTPFRLSLFGGGSDYKPWLESREGLIIAMAMKKYCYISLRDLPPFFDHHTRLVYSRVESVASNHEIEHPSIRSCLEFLDCNRGLEIHHDGDLPARSGIGSSSTFTVGMLHALHGYRGEMVTKEQLAKEAIKVEQDWIKESVGIQDQIMASFGGFNLISMQRDDFQVQPMILPPDYLEALESHILLAFTGTHRNSSEYAAQHIANLEKGSTFDAISEMVAITKQARDLFAKNADFHELGKLLDESWRIKRSLTKTVSTTEIDDIYETAIRQGAYGGKLMGAGGGGFLMFFAPPHRHSAIKKALPQLRVWVPFSVDLAGSQIIFFSNQDQDYE